MISLCELFDATPIIELMSSFYKNNFAEYIVYTNMKKEEENDEKNKIK